jgi:uncharacterized membrane protein YphA (DoxX/SURF4 family)
MNINGWLWILQALCAALFLGTGLMKLAKGREDLAKRFAWTRSVPEFLVRGIGALEVLGGLGLILPGLTRILPILTPVAALGLTVTMVGATATNLRTSHYPALALSLPLTFVCGFIAFGRFVLTPL